MAECTNITLEKIRAEIDFGGLLKFETPDIQSFTVNKSRTSLASTFSASIEVPATTIFPIGQDVTIKAGVEGNLITIFTGRVFNITVNPSFEKATTYVINLSGSDRFFDLEGHTFSRRQRTRGQTTFAAITGVTTKVPQKGISLEKRIGTGGTHRITSTDTNLREHSKLVSTDRVSFDPFATAKDPQVVNAVSAGTAGSSNSLVIRPTAVALSPGVSVLFTLEGATFESGNTWAVSDSSIGTIVNNQDGTATYTQSALGENVITFTQGSLTGIATTVGTTLHDHSSLGQGGPAHAVYGSE